MSGKGPFFLFRVYYVCVGALWGQGATICGARGHSRSG